MWQDTLRLPWAGFRRRSPRQLHVVNRTGTFRTISTPSVRGSTVVPRRQSSGPCFHPPSFPLTPDVSSPRRGIGRFSFHAARETLRAAALSPCLHSSRLRLVGRRPSPITLQTTRTSSHEKPPSTPFHGRGSWRRISGLLVAAGTAAPKTRMHAPTARGRRALGQLTPGRATPNCPVPPLPRAASGESAVCHKNLAGRSPLLRELFKPSTCYFLEHGLQLVCSG